MSRHGDRLIDDIYWIGGSPCSGKSTVAARLAADHGLGSYCVDDHEQAHTKRAHPERQPTMYRLGTMAWDAIWSRPVECQVEEELAYYRERFAMVMDDLTAWDGTRPLVAEGAGLLPALLKELGIGGRRAYYLVPGRDFQLEHYARRPWVADILASCADPEDAFGRWMERDQRFGRQIARQARACGWPVQVIDGRQTVEQVGAAVERHFALG